MNALNEPSNPEEIEDPFPEGEFTIRPLMDSFSTEPPFPKGALVAAIIGGIVLLGGIVYLIVVGSTIHCSTTNTTCELGKAFNTAGGGLALFIGGVILATAWWSWNKWKNRIDK